MHTNVENNPNGSGRKTKKMLQNKRAPTINPEYCCFADDIQKLFFEDLTKKKVFIIRI